MISSHDSMGGRARETASLSSIKILRVLRSGYYCFSTGSVNHSLTYGVDYYEKESIYRTAETFNAQGIQMPEFYAYPTRDYPITR